MSNRLTYIDFAKGAGILLMLAAHIDSFVLKEWSYSFHMPLFFIISGYCSSSKNIRDTIRDGAKQLLIPYLVVCFSVIFYFLCFQTINHFIKGSSFYFHQLLDYILWTPFSWGVFVEHSNIHIGVVWFLWAMFWGRIWKATIETIIPKTFHLLSALMLFLIAIYLPIGAYNFWGFKQGMQATSFLMIGSYFKRKNVYENKNTFWLASCVFFLFAQNFAIDMSWWRYPLGIFNVITATILSLSFVWLCKAIDSLSINILSSIQKTIRYIGRNSLFFLCCEAVLLSTQLFKPIMGMPWIFVFIIKFIFMFTCCYFLSNIWWARHIFNLKTK